MSLSSRKLMWEVGIFILLTIYLVVEKEAPSREYIFAIWLLYFILCSTNFSEYTFKSTEDQITDMRYKIKNHIVNYDDIDDIANIIKTAGDDPFYKFVIGSDDEGNFIVEVKKL